jgi:predicted ABC-type transport system involved in lysophospholipase L1 biosynthesis ATPase subunit
MVDMEPPKSVDATLFGSSEALIHRSGSGISVLLGVSDGFRISSDPQASQGDQALGDADE